SPGSLVSVGHHLVLDSLFRYLKPNPLSSRPLEGSAHAHNHYRYCFIIVKTVGNHSSAQDTSP
ncbi:MAG: hypothetical protein ABI813_12000, partial [Bacteroidota bacterium]